MNRVGVRYDNESRIFKFKRRPQFRPRDLNGLYEDLTALPGVEYAIRTYGQENWEINLDDGLSPHNREDIIEKIKQCFWTHGVELAPVDKA